MSEEVAVLIDNGYLKEVCKQIFGNILPKINYLKLSEEICKKIDKKRYRTYFYDRLPGKARILQRKNPKDIQKSEKFFNPISKLPSFEVRRRIPKFFLNENGSNPCAPRTVLNAPVGI